MTYWWSLLSVIGSLVLGMTMLRGGDPLVWLAGSAAGSAVTGPLLWATLRLRRRYRGRWLGIGVSLAAAWLVMIVVIVTVFSVQRDPFAAERIARSGLILYFLADRLLRGIFFGVLAGTFMFVWAWLPMGLLWRHAVGRIERARDERHR